MKKLIPYSGNLCSRYAEKMISIKLTSKCNAKCSFCVDKGGYTPKTKNDCGSEISVPDVDAIVETANKYKDYKTVIITGGEPLTVFPFLIDVLKGLRKTKKRLVVNTNGSLLCPEYVYALNGLIDELQISIHHPDEEINNKIFGFKFDKSKLYQPYIHFELIKLSLKWAKFDISVNSCFNKYLKYSDRIELEKLANDLGANKLRLTELKKVDASEFIEASDYYPSTDEFCNRSSEDLITNGCMTEYIADCGLKVSVKRLCKYAKGMNAPAFSCCFINNDGQTKIDVDTKDTFKVIYADGSVYDDWIFTGL